MTRSHQQDLRHPARKRVRVNAFSWVPVSLWPQDKESGRVFASFVAGVLTKEGVPCGGRKGVGSSEANFLSPPSELGKVRASTGSKTTGQKVNSPGIAHLPVFLDRTFSCHRR